MPTKPNIAKRRNHPGHDLLSLGLIAVALLPCSFILYRILENNPSLGFVIENAGYISATIGLIIGPMVVAGAATLRLNRHERRATTTAAGIALGFALYFLLFAAGIFVPGLLVPNKPSDEYVASFAYFVCLVLPVANALAVVGLVRLARRSESRLTR